MADMFTRNKVAVLLLTVGTCLFFTAASHGQKYWTSLKIHPPTARLPEQGGAATKIRFVNNSKQELTYYWCHGLKMELYGRVPAGGGVTQDTYAGHIWLVRGTMGRALGKCVATTLPGLAVFR